MHELLKVHLTRRKVEPGALDYKTPEKAAGNTLRQTIALRQGIDADLARQLVREIKDSKLKVQAAVQGDELRVTGKKRDDLQAAIALVRGLKIEQPLQYRQFPRMSPGSAVGAAPAAPAGLDRAPRQPLSRHGRRDRVPFV